MDFSALSGLSEYDLQRYYDDVLEGGSYNRLSYQQMVKLEITCSDNRRIIIMGNANNWLDAQVNHCTSGSALAFYSEKQAACGYTNASSCVKAQGNVWLEVYCPSYGRVGFGIGYAPSGWAESRVGFCSSLGALAFFDVKEEFCGNHYGTACVKRYLAPS